MNDPVGQIPFGVDDFEGWERFSRRLMGLSVQHFPDEHVEGSAKVINIGAIAGECSNSADATAFISYWNDFALLRDRFHS